LWNTERAILRSPISARLIRARALLSARAHPNWLFAVHLLLGDHLPWRQGWDLSQAVRYLGALREFTDLPIVL
jgi:hypothetical protein